MQRAQATDLRFPDGALKRERVQSWLQAELARRLGLKASEIDTNERFHRYGLDSARATQLVSDLSELLGLQLSATVVWDYPTIASLAAFLAGEPTSHRPSALPMPARLPDGDRDEEPIAIVGMACRFPGAPDIEAFWRLLSEGVDAITEVPADRWDINALYNPDPAAPGKMSTRWGGFLDQIDAFDAQFFGISPREAMVMDPQQRLMLELSWEALEDAGIVPSTLKGTKCGVFFGVIWNDYATLSHRLGLEAIVQHSATGAHYSIVANRVSYTLGLEGPSMAVDTACSSSLVAVHLACRSLQGGEATVALAGGVNLVVAADSTLAMSKFGAMAPDGRSKAFDARADGYVRGEGAGVVVLKPLSRALADGNPIYCIVRGSAVNNDGFSNGLTAPNPRAQKAVLREAYARASRKPGSVHYVEAHGTGTILGDPIEVKALGQVLGAERDTKQPLRIGSVKTNIGHLEAAAGVAGLMKVALAIKHAAIPPSLHFEKPNPHIPWDDLAVRVQTKLEPWPAAREPLLCGISSFGFGGTNCHMVVEGMAKGGAAVLPLSAATPERLRLLIHEARDALEDWDGNEGLEAFCLAAALALGTEPCRFAVAVRSREEMRAALGTRHKLSMDMNTLRGGEGPPPRIVFVCSGQGGQWLGMGRELIRTEPVFRACIEACDRAIQASAGWSLFDELMAHESRSRLSEVNIVQPVLFSMQVALGELWRSWGIDPDVLVGHSMGEIAAAYLSGILTLNDAVHVICRRSEAVRRLAPAGSMAVVALSAQDAAGAIKEFANEIFVAGSNSPSSTVLAGTSHSLEHVLQRLESDGVYVGRVKVDYASHSPHVDALRMPLFNALDGLRPGHARSRLLSTVTLQDLNAVDCGPRYWVRNLREPVLFSQAIQKLLSEGPCIFIELSPHPALVKPVQEGISHAGKPGAVYPSMRRGEPEHLGLFEALAALYTAGGNVSWHKVYAGIAPRDLPPRLLSPDRTAVPARHQSHTEPVLLPISAHTSAALSERAGALHQWFSTRTELDFDDLYHTATLHRTHFEHRAAVTALSRQEILDALVALRHGGSHPALATGTHSVTIAPEIVFVFPGHGSQWLGMGRELFETEPVFRHALDAAGRVLTRYTEWSVIEQIQASESTSRLNEADVIQPMIFATQVALAALWRSWGIEPAAVVGHSMGEVTAAYVAGALSLEDAACVIAQRSRIIRQHASGKGVCTMVELSLEEALEAVEGFGDALVVGTHNGPRNCVLSGAPDAMDEMLARLRSRNVFYRPVKMDYASHSPQMDPLKSLLKQALSAIEPKPDHVPFYSSVTREWIAGERLDAEYWAQNLRGRVHFADAVQALREKGLDVFLEVSTHPVLVTPIAETLRALGKGGHVLASVRKNELARKSLHPSLARLYTLGCMPNWTRLHPRGGRVVPLPLFPWQRDRYWIEPRTQSPALHAGSPSGIHVNGSTPGRPILGSVIRPANQSGLFLWEMEIAADSMPYLHDHKIRGLVIFPAAIYLALVLRAVNDVFSPQEHALRSVKIDSALDLSLGARKVQLVVTQERGGGAFFQIQSWEPGEDRDGSWRLHVEGWTHRLAGSSSPENTHLDVENISTSGFSLHSAETHYESMRKRGLEYGPSFQRIEQLWRTEGVCIAKLRLHSDPPMERDAYPLHPALLDASFQAAVAALPGNEDGVSESETYLPVGIAALSLLVRSSTVAIAWCRATLRPQSGDDAERFLGDIELFDAGGQLVAHVAGLALTRVRAAVERIESSSFAVQWEPKPLSQTDSLPQPSHENAKPVWIIFGDRAGTCERVTDLLTGKGARCVTVTHGETFCSVSDDLYRIRSDLPDDVQLLFDDIGNKALACCNGIIYALSLDIPRSEDMSSDEIIDAERLACGGALAVVQALVRAFGESPPRLWLVTAGAQGVSGENETLSVAQAPLWGLGRVIAREHPELSCTLVDLDPALDLEQSALLCAEVLSGDSEGEIALRGRTRWVSRLVRYPWPAGIERTVTEEIPAVPGRDAFRLESLEPERLALCAVPRRLPGPGEVEIQVCAAGLDQDDRVESPETDSRASGGDILLGSECAGRISALGPGVSGFRIGDEVVALAEHTIGSFVVVRVELVAQKPGLLSFEQAAALPSALVAAHYALLIAGRLQRGERVMIDGAASAFGLAALQIAQQAGAQVFAAGNSPEQCEYLASQGVAHVLDGASAPFPATAGDGFDLVVVSGGGNPVPATLRLLRPFGRLVDIGCAGTVRSGPLGVDPFDKCLSYAAVDMQRLRRERPALVEDIFREIFAGPKTFAYRSFACHTFPISKVVDAFRFAAKRAHTGKVVISLQEESVMVRPGQDPMLRSDGTYLVTGGLGGLGLKTAGWMAAHGAGNIVLIGRRGPGAEMESALDELKRQGARVVFARSDVAAFGELSRVLADVLGTLPPVRGVIHAAGVLEDKTVLGADQGGLLRVMAPKVQGAWNLHLLTRDQPLDFFVVYSSVASLLGLAGQASYAAANAFLDALAHHRRALGLQGLSINWGPWAEVGMAAAQDNRGRRLAHKGLRSLRPEFGLLALRRILATPAAQVAIALLDPDRWMKSHPGTGQGSFFAHLKVTENPADASAATFKPGSRLDHGALLAAPAEERQLLLESYLCEQLSGILKLPPAKLEVDQPFMKLGLDSLMTVEFRNLVEADLNLRLSATMVWNYPNIKQLAKHIADKLGAPPDPKAPAGIPDGAAARPVTDAVETILNLTEDEAEAALLQKLAQLKETRVI